MPPATWRSSLAGARTWVLTARTPTTARDVLRATLWGMAASVAVESIQLLSAFRTASLVDVLTNTLGSLIGAMSLWLVERRAAGDMRRGTMIGVPGWLPAGALALTAFGVAFAPSSRASMAIAWESSPLARAQHVATTPALVVGWPALGNDVVLWFAVGAVVAIAISDRTGRVRLAQMAGWLTIVSGLILVAHTGRELAGLQREVMAWQVQAMAVAAGLVVGLVAVPGWRNAVSARSTRAIQLALLAMGVGALMSWYPASWAVPKGGASFSWRQLVPMMSLFQRQDIASVFLVLQKAGVGAAVGACLAARKRVGEPRPGLRAAVAYAALLEAGQLLIPGRYPDVTDILITGATACLVAVLVERADRGARDVTVPAASGLNGRA